MKLKINIAANKSGMRRWNTKSLQMPCLQEESYLFTSGCPQFSVSVTQPFSFSDILKGFCAGICMILLKLLGTTTQKSPKGKNKIIILPFYFIKKERGANQLILNIPNWMLSLSKLLLSAAEAQHW